MDFGTVCRVVIDPSSFVRLGVPILSLFLTKICNRRGGLTNSQIKKPSLSYPSGQPLFYQAPPQLHELTKGNLEKLMVDLVSQGDEVVVTDPALPFTLNVVIKYE
jgi:ubiquitin-activating enzyme E1 C